MTKRTSQPSPHRPPCATPHRSPLWLYAAAVGWLAMVLLAAGCTTGSTATNRSPTTAAQLTRAEVYERIDLAGPADEPLLWEIEWPADPHAAAAVRAAQHFEALVALLFASELRAAAPEYPLLAQIATGAELESIGEIVQRPPNPRAVTIVGPRWIWLLEARVGVREAMVVFCFDSGYWRESGVGGRSPTVGSRSEVLVYWLVRGSDPAEATWLVNDAVFDRVQASEPGLTLTEEEAEANRQRCVQWATHTPADILRYARPSPAAR